MNKQMYLTKYIAYQNLFKVAYHIGNLHIELKTIENWHPYLHVP